MENTDQKKAEENDAVSGASVESKKEDIVDFESFFEKEKLSPELKKQLRVIIEFAVDANSHQRFMDAQIPLTLDISEIAKWLAGKVPTGLRFPDPRAEATERKSAQVLVDKTTVEVIKAMQYFIAKAMLAPGADHYRVLGLKIQSSTEEIQNNYRCLRRIFYPSEGSEAAQACVMRISDAYVTLRNAQTRRDYNERLFGKQSNLYVSNVSLATEKVKPAKKASKPKSTSRLPMFFGTLFVVVLLAGLLYWSLLPDLPAQKVERNAEALSPGSVPSASENLGVATSLDEVIDTLRDNDIDTSLIEQTTPTDSFQAEEQPVLPEEVAEQRAVVETAASVTQEQVESTEPPAVSAQQREIQRLLDEGYAYLEVSRLTQPAGRNAFEKFSAVLAIDPRNVQARDGLEKIAASYVNLARFRINLNRYEDANLMISRGLQVLPNYPPLLRLQTRVADQLALNQASVVVPEPSPEPVAVPESSPEPVVVVPEPATPEPVAEPELVVEVERTPVEPVVQVAPVKPAVVVVPTPEPEKGGELTYLDEQGRVSEAALDALIDRFIDTYEKGDLKGFLALFSDDANTNNRKSKKEIKADYEALFSTTKSRLMRIRGIRWKRTPESAVGDADFRLTIFRANSSRPKTFEGSLTFQVKLLDGKPLIEGLFHSQDRVKR